MNKSKSKSDDKNIVLKLFEKIVIDYSEKYPNDLLYILFSKIKSVQIVSSGNVYSFLMKLLEKISNENFALFDESFIFYKSIVKLAPTICEEAHEYFKFLESELDKYI